MSKESVHCRTKDVEEAAYLRCANFDFIGTELAADTRRSTVIFVFEVPEGVEPVTVRRTYTNRKAKVEPKMYAENLRDMQNYLHDTLRQGATIK